MVSLQLVDVGFVFNDALLILTEVGQLIFQRSIHLNWYSPDLLQTSCHGDTNSSLMTFLLWEIRSSSYTNGGDYTAILFWIHGPIMLAWLANWRLRWSLDCWRASSSWRAWSRCGTSCCTFTRTQDNINTCKLNSFVNLHPNTWRKQCLIHNTNRSYLLPLLVNALRGDGGVRIVSSQFDAIVLCNFLNFSLDGLNSFPLFICLWKSWFELVVSSYQSLQKEREVKKCQRRDSCIQHFFCSATKQGSPFQRF